MGDHTYEKAFINALFLAFQNFANSQTVANEHCNGRCPKVCNMPMLYSYEHCTDTVVTYMHIGVGLLHCSFRLLWAMRRPRNAGRVMIQAPALFLCGCISFKLYNSRIRGCL